MTNPLGNIGAGSPPVVQVRGGLEDYLPIILQTLQASAARKQRQAEEAVGQIAAGSKGKDLTPDQRKAYQRATGVKLGDEDVAVPLPATSDEATLDRIMGNLGIAKGSTMDIGLRTSLARRTATGLPSPPTTPAAIAAETQGTEDLATAGATQAGQFKAAVTKVSQAPQGQNVELTGGELAAYQRFNQFVPSQPIADQLTGRAKAEVMTQALRVAADPNSATWAKLLPEGVTPADVIGGTALGVGGLIESGAAKKNIIEATASQEAIKAAYGAAETLSKAMGGKYSPEFVVHVMQGDPKAVNTDAGAMVQRFMDASFMTAITVAGEKGDPATIAITRLLELGRIPQIASNPEVLFNYSNLVRDLMANGITRTHLGYDRPAQEGDAQSTWDKYNNAIRGQMGGVFSPKSWYQFGTMTVTPVPGQPGSEEAAAAEKKRRDAQMAEDAIRAIYGIPPAAPGKSPGSLFNVKP